MVGVSLTTIKSLFGTGDIGESLALVDFVGDDCCGFALGGGSGRTVVLVTGREGSGLDTELADTFVVFSLVKIAECLFLGFGGGDGFLPTTLILDGGKDFLLEAGGDGRSTPATLRDDTWTDDDDLFTDTGLVELGGGGGGGRVLGGEGRETCLPTLLMSSSLPLLKSINGSGDDAMIKNSCYSIKHKIKLL